jgi:hypothetical protein
MKQLKPIRKLSRAFVTVAIVLAPVICHAAAYYNVGAWFKTQQNKLMFTTAAQSVIADTCSGIATVQTKTPVGVAINVASNLTVNLSGPSGVTFYSDTSCTSAITSVTISSGTSSASFYFLDTTTGSATITASATAYSSATQAETLTTNPYIWTGGGANALWATAANWSGGAAPGSGNTAVFKGSTCSSNCSPTIGASINIKGIRMASDYTGTITQSAGKTVTVGSIGWAQLGGTYVGSSSGDAITIGGNYILQSPGSFVATGTSLVFTNSYATPAITPGNVTYNNVTFSGTGMNFSLGGATMNIGGTLSLGATSAGGTFNSGTLAVGGNVTVTGTGGFTGSVLIKLTGNASGQTVSSTGGGSLPNLTIDTGTNPVTMSGSITFTGNYIVTTVGTFTSTGSTLSFTQSYNTATITPGSVTYNNVAFGGTSATYDLGGGTMTLAGSLTLNKLTNGTGVINSGTLAVAGDLTATGASGFTGSAVIKLTGNAAGQTVSMPSTGTVSNLTIDTGTNPVTLSGTVTVTGNYIVNTVGTFTVTGSTLVLAAVYTSQTLTPGSVTYNNVTFGGTSGTYTLGGATMTIAGTFSLSASAGDTINSGNFALSGDFTKGSGGAVTGSATIQFVGTGTQTITLANALSMSGAVTINKASGAVVLASNVNQTPASWTLTAGTLYMSGYSFTINGLALNGNTIHRKNVGATSAAGVLTVGGTAYGNGSFLGGTVAD